MMKNKKNKYLYSLLIVIIIIILIILKYNNPENVSIFPPCLFYKLTGIKCAGCGITRAMHNLLNFEFEKALLLNPLIYVYIFYFIYVVAKYIILKQKLKKVTIDNYTYSLYVILIVTILFMILRNIINI